MFNANLTIVTITAHRPLPTIHIAPAPGDILGLFHAGDTWVNCLKGAADQLKSRVYWTNHPFTADACRHYMNALDEVNSLLEQVK